jgi:hypothetical protein
MDGVDAMSFRDLVFYLICAATWLILLPVFVVGGALILLGYAVFSEVTDVFLGRTTALDHKAVREMARRMCLGH